MYFAGMLSLALVLDLVVFCC